MGPETLAVFNPKDKDTKNQKININYNMNAEYKENSKGSTHPKIDYRQIERKWTSQIWELFNSTIIKNKDKENMDIDKREELKQSDFKLQLMSLSFGMETVNPIEKMFLYNSKNPRKKNQVHCDQITTMSGTFREVVVRAYVKKTEWKSECEQIFKLFAQKNGLVQDSQYYGDRQHSLNLSPNTRKKSAKKRTMDDLGQSSTALTSELSPLNNKKDNGNNSRKRKHSSSIPITGSNSIDLMDTAQRNKKPRHK